MCCGLVCEGCVRSGLSDLLTAAGKASKVLDLGLALHLRHKRLFRCHTNGLRG